MRYDNEPKPRSKIFIELVDDDPIEFYMDASPSTTGFLTLWNGGETLCIRADRVKEFCITPEI
jgi:hypothetical protein